MKVRKVGERGKRWDVRDKWCIGRMCFHPVEKCGIYENECLNRFNGNCPLAESYDPIVRIKHEAEGWRNV